MISPFKIGLPRHTMEAGEHRDFLPDFVALLNRHGSASSTRTWLWFKDGFY